MLTDTDENQPAIDTEIRDYLKKLFATCLNVSEEELDDGESFFSLGLTSIVHTEVHSRLSRIASDLSSTVLFEYPNINLLTSLLADKQVPRTLLVSDFSEVSN